jgi:hypothetical protein
MLLQQMSRSTTFTGLLASAIIKMDGVAGLSGWRWIFILEGIATVVIGFIAWAIMPTDLGSAKFLTEEERQFAGGFFSSLDPQTLPLIEFLPLSIFRPQSGDSVNLPRLPPTRPCRNLHRESRQTILRKKPKKPKSRTLLKRLLPCTLKKKNSNGGRSFEESPTSKSGSQLLHTWALSSLCIRSPCSCMFSSHIPRHHFVISTSSSRLLSFHQAFHRRWIELSRKRSAASHRCEKIKSESSNAARYSHITGHQCRLTSQQPCSPSSSLFSATS